MSLLTWKEENSVGVKELDEQHKRIIAMINDLYETMQKTGQGKDPDGLLGELTSYAKLHFGTEEKYFEEFGYELREGHVAQHEAYRRRVDELREKMKSEGSGAMSIEIIDFLEDWWIGHINHEDKKYTKCFNEHGLT